MKKTLALFFLSFFLFASSASAVDVYPAIGYLAPDFELKSIDNKKHKLSNYKGKVVLLNFWATWCYPCRSEMPELEKLQQMMKSSGDFVILAVGTDQSGIPDVQSFIRQNKYTFTALADPGGRLVNNLYRLNGIPVTVIIGKDGIIRERISGVRDWASDSNVTYIKQLIAE